MTVLSKFLFLLTVAFSAASTADRSPVNLDLKDLSGVAQSLSQYRGKIVVLNFWATWCEPCEEEMHEFVDIRKKFSVDDVSIVGASLDDEVSQRKIPKFMRQQKMQFPVWIGATVDDLQKLGLGEGVPGTIFLDREGRVIARVKGPISKKELKERLEWALANKGEYPVPVLDHFSKH